MTDKSISTNMEDTTNPTGRWVPGFIALSIIWGSSFALIKVAVDAGVTPLWVALWRCLFGAMALGAIALVGRHRLPRSGIVWAHAAVIAVLLNAAPFALFSYGEQHVSSLLAGVWNATTPLTTLVFVLLLIPTERPTGRRIAGLAFGFVGVLFVLGIWEGITGGTMLGSLACLGATTCYGAGFAYTRRYFTGTGESAVSLTTAQILCATVELAVVIPFFDGGPTWPGVPAGLALVALGAIGTGVAYILNFTTIRLAGASVASTVTYVTPLWSTLIGVLLLSEHLGWNTIVGAAFVIVGIMLTRRSSATKRLVGANAAPDDARTES
jgi:drug/metabolite transporter (DMT)-like permease